MGLCGKNRGLDRRVKWFCMTRTRVSAASTDGRFAVAVVWVMAFCRGQNTERVRERMGVNGRN